MNVSVNKESTLTIPGRKDASLEAIKRWHSEEFTTATTPFTASDLLQGPSRLAQILTSRLLHQSRRVCSILSSKLLKISSITKHSCLRQSSTHSHAPHHFCPRFRKHCSHLELSLALAEHQSIPSLRSKVSQSFWDLYLLQLWTHMDFVSSNALRPHLARHTQHLLHQNRTIKQLLNY